MVGLRVTTEASTAFVICTSPISHKENVMLSFHLLSGILFTETKRIFNTFVRADFSKPNQT